MSKGADTPGGLFRDIAGAVAAKLLRTRDGKKSPRPRDRALAPLPGDPVGGSWASARPTGFGGLMPPYGASDTALAVTPAPSDEMHGEAIEGVPTVTVPVTPKARPAEPLRSTRQESRRGPAAWLAARPEDSRLDQLRATAAGPELGTTMSQRVATEEAGRAAVKGDKSGLRLALADLVQKMDLSSPKDSAVLVPQALGQYGAGELSSLMNRGRMTLEMTQGGQLFRQVAPLLKQFSNVDITGEIDGAWNGMSERFAKTATGTVEVVLGPDTIAPDAAAPGGGANPAAGASGAPEAGTVPQGGRAARPLTMREVPAPPDGVQQVDLAGERAQRLAGLREVAPPAESDAAEPVGLGGQKHAGGLPMREVAPSGASDSSEDVDLKGADDRGRLRVKEASEPAAEETTVRVGGRPAGGLTVREAPVPVDDVARVNPRVAGRLSLRELLTANPDITAVALRQPPGPSGGSGVVTTVARDVLLQKLSVR